MELDSVRHEKQCSYCHRAFSRWEHLSRHERSHRNERPYRCSSCDTTFSRQDTFKRHQSRYHSQLVERNDPQQDQDPSAVPSPGLDPALAPPVTAWDECEPTAAWQAAMFDPTYLLPMGNLIPDFSVAELGFPPAPASGSFASLPEEPREYMPAASTSGCPAPRLDSTAVAPAFPAPMSAMSEQKHRQLMFEIDAVAPTMQKPSDFELPSRFALERLLDTFAECFLVYIPCIHIPTWKAERAPPCVILAMASIGASYHDDDVTSYSLSRIAKASLEKHIGTSPHTIANEPLWVLQCLLLMMANGSKSASFQVYQEATSLTRLLIEGLRYRKGPPCAPATAEREIALTEQWHKWIEYESTIRTICAVYIHLSALGVTFQTAHGLYNLDMNDCFLPCDEVEWTSTTPRAWLGNRESNSKPRILFSAAMASLSSSQTCAPPPSLSAFGLYVTLHGIVKQWDSLNQEVWLLAATPKLVQQFTQALDTWRMWSEQNPEFHISPRYPNGVIAANALSLYRQAHVRLYASFGLLRSALATRNVQTILDCIKKIKVNICGSNLCLRAARCSFEALRTSIKMGLFLAGSISGWDRKLLFNLYSIECCLFLSFWIREQSNRPGSDWSPEQDEIINLTREMLTEVNVDPIVATRPCSIQLIYAWGRIFELCNASGLHAIIAEVLNTYADSLIE